MATPQATPSPIPARTERRSLLWGMRWYALGIGFSYAIRLARGGVLPKFLPPDQYGLAMSLILPLSYLRYADLGVTDQLVKRLPFFRASEGEEGFRRHVSLGAAWTLGTAVLAAIAVIGSSFWIGGGRAGYYQTGFRLVALILVAQRLRFLLTIILNAREEFHQSQVGAMLVEGTLFVYSVIGVILLGPIGVIWAMLFSEITGSIYLVAKSGLPRLAWAIRPMITMVREGLLLLALALTELALLTVDQIFLLRFFPVAEYGLYVLGGAYLNFYEIPRALFDATQPRVMSLTGAGKHSEAKNLVATTLIMYSLVVAAALCVGLPCAAVALHFYLTRYQAGLGLYVIMPLQSIFRGPTALLRPYYLSKNKERRLIFYEAMGLLTMVVLNGLTIVLKGGLLGIVLSTACGWGVSSLLLLRGFEGSLRALAKQFKQYAYYAASTIGAVCLYAFWLANPASAASTHSVVRMSFGALVYGLGLAVVVYFTRTVWGGALKILRAQPQVEEKDMGIVISEIAGELPESIG